MAGERAGHSLQATALVNEAYLRLINAKDVAWHDRAHFLAVAARVMRRILVDHARSRHYQKRGGDAARVTLDEALVVASEPDQDFVALDEALTALAAVDARKSQVVEMRFFGGLTHRRDGRGAAGLTRYGETRLENGEAVVTARTARRQARCHLTAGGRLRISVTPHSRAVPRSAGRFWQTPVRAMKDCCARSSRCSRRNPAPKGS